MSHNFLPTQNQYNNLGKFRFWCQKVLPLVYDDSLSYYELLCKVVHYLNETIENVDLVGEDMQKLYTAFEQLNEYVVNYFTNLDVQKEINIKLDNMFSDGTLTVIIDGVLSDYKEEFNKAIAYQNAGIKALTNRMDTFTRLGAGSTTGDAELLDIRVGADGTVYESAGTSTREQFLMRNIKSETVADVNQLDLVSVEEVTKEVVTVIETKGAEVINSIPQDYTKALEDVETLTIKTETLYDGIVPIEKLNGCVVSCGEEVILTVGEHVEVGQVLSFKYKANVGYSVEARGSIMYTFEQPPVDEDGYVETTFIVVEGYDYCKFVGAYFSVVPCSGKGGVVGVTNEQLQNAIVEVEEQISRTTNEQLQNAIVEVEGQIGVNLEKSFQNRGRADNKNIDELINNENQGQWWVEVPKVQGTHPFDSGYYFLICYPYLQVAIRFVSTDGSQRPIKYRYYTNNRWYSWSNDNSSNPNLLINGDFQVWQRGTSFDLQTNGGYKYTADRWCVATSNSHHIEKASGGGITLACSLYQHLENPLKNGHEYVLSANIDGVVYTLRVIGGTNASNDYLKYSSSSTKETVQIVANSNGQTIKWVKLEKGAIATPFIPRLYGEEFSLCQRYFQVISSVRARVQTHVDNKMFFRLYYDTTMRLFPSYVLREIGTPSIVLYKVNGWAELKKCSTSDVSFEGDASHVDIKIAYTSSYTDCTLNISNCNITMDAEIY